MNFSVVIPSFNSSKTLAKALDSCLTQTVQPSEVIIVDDYGEEIMEHLFDIYKERFANKNIKIIFIRLEKNRGAAAARNEGWNAATSDYVAFLDADDFWHHEKLKICRDFLLNTSAALLFHSFSYSSDINERANDSYKSYHVRAIDFFIKNLSATSCFIVKRTIQFRFDETMRYTEDHDLWLRISATELVLRIEGPALAFLGRPILSPGGLSANKLRMRLGEIKMFTKFCLSKKIYFLLPFLVLFSCCKHALSFIKLYKGSVN